MVAEFEVSGSCDWFVGTQSVGIQCLHGGQQVLSTA